MSESINERKPSKIVWDTKKISAAKRIIVKRNGRRLAIDKEDLQRLKSGKDVVGYSLKYPGQEEWVLARDKWEIEESVNESILSEKKPSKIVWDTKKISAAKRINVRNWYMKTYSDDELGAEIDKRISLWDVYTALSQGHNVYKIIGVGDSVVRERVFEKLSNVLGVDYDTIYNMMESVNEANVVGKAVFDDGKGKLAFGYYKDDDEVTLVDYKTWKKLNFKDVSKGDTNKDRLVKAILRKQKQFNKKVDYNTWSKKTNPSFEEKMDWFIKNGWISNVTKRGIKEGVSTLMGEGRAFVAAAKKAKEEGKTEFEFNGKTYPVTIKEVLRKRNRKLR